MLLTFDPDLYNLSDGRVLAKFTGLRDYQQPQKFGSANPDYGPALRWEFEIVSGPDAGKPCGVITAKHPTPKNSCIRMLTGIIGHRPAEREPIDTSRYVGKYYLVTISDGYMSHQFPPQFMGVSQETATKATELITGDPLATTDGESPIPY